MKARDGRATVPLAAEVLETRVLAPEVVRSSWWDSPTAADYLGITRRALDHRVTHNALPEGACKIVDGIRYFDPEAIRSLQKTDPNQELWRQISDLMRSHNAGVEANQKHQERFISAFLNPIERVIELQSSEIARLQTENERLRDRVFAGLQAVEEAASQSAERDLKLVAATNRQRMLHDTFSVLRELAPRLLEQFAGIREVKKEIGKLKAEELVTLLPLVPEGARQLLVAIHTEEQQRSEALAKTLHGGNGAAVAETNQTAGE